MRQLAAPVLSAGAALIFLLHARRNGANRIGSLRGDFDAMNEKKEIPSAEKAPAPCDTDQSLKTAREARGLSLSDIFQATRVSMINLQALENGDFKALPPPVYTRNFIRKYARAVGADEMPFLKRYERYLESQNPPREEPGVQKPWPDTGRRYRFLFGSLAIVIVAGILVYALFLYDQSGRTIPPVQPIESPSAVLVEPEPAVPIPIVPVAPAKPTEADSVPARGKAAIPPPAASSAVPAPTTAPGSVPGTGKPAIPSPATASAVPAQTTAAGSAPVTGKATLPPPAAASGKTLNLVIEARELSWLRITEGRNPSYQVLLKSGDRIERTASDFFLLDIGNAAGVNLIFQGKPLGSLGKPGQVIHLRLPDQAAEKESP
jgi:cytoskeleton protein RodZ